MNPLEYLSNSYSNLNTENKNFISVKNEPAHIKEEKLVSDSSNSAEYKENLKELVETLETNSHGTEVEVEDDKVFLNIKYENKYEEQEEEKQRDIEENALNENFKVSSEEIEFVQIKQENEEIEDRKVQIESEEQKMRIKYEPEDYNEDAQELEEDAEQRLHICTLCSKTFSQKQNLQRHNVNIHNAKKKSKRKYICTCNGNSEDQDLLNQETKIGGMYCILFFRVY